MRIWRVNLIDNREKDSNTPGKFRQCKSLGIIAIGWAKEDPLSYYQNGDLKAYKAAIKDLSRIAIGDAVWVRDTVKKEYYICKVCGELEKAPPALWDKDIGQYRRAEWFGPVPQAELPAPLTVRRLVSRATIRCILRPDIVQATIMFFDSTLVHKKLKLEVTK